MARNVLTQKQRFVLTNYVQENYVKFGTSDRVFAETASKALDIPVNANHVDAARDVLEIPATRFVVQEPTKIIDRIELLEKRLALAEDKINILTKAIS